MNKRIVIKLIDDIVKWNQTLDLGKNNLFN